VLAAAVASTVAAGSTPQIVAAPPANFTDTLVANVGSPTAMAFVPDGRILVTTQFGDVRVIANDALVPQPALDLSAGLCTANEMGLLGVEVDPAFASNGFVYLYYTRSAGGACENRVSRFVMSGNVIAPASETVLIDRIPATEGNHNAGDLHFGRDGYLYVTVGDGGCDYDDSGCAGGNDAARDEHILLGKVLRITSAGGIPPTNPFLGAGTARCAATGRTTVGQRCQETFAWGLRNPFRIAFDPNAAGTRFFINDVGQNLWEEVDEGIAGADYGWNVREGPCAEGSQTSCGPPPAGMTNPIHWYAHGECNAITGGAFVPNGIWPSSYDGTYLYGDYTCGRIFLLTPNGSGGYTRSEFATNVGSVVNLAFGPSPAGTALYYTNYTNGGQVRRIGFAGTTNRAPTAALTASPTFGPPPLNVTFDGSGSSDPDVGDTLTYIWSFGDGSPTVQTTTSTTSHTYSTAGTYSATLTVRDNRGASSTPAGVQISPGESPPQVTIDTPTASTLFGVGQTLTMHGTATDAQDGTLAASRLTWTVLKHHDTHTHPFLAPTTGNDIPITAPAPEDLLAATNSFLEIRLTATDSRGLSTTVTRNVQPHKVDLTLATSPSGLKVTVNGEQKTGPTTMVSWRNWALDVGAQSQVDSSGRSWTFSSWSDGGAASHQFTTPSTATTLTATFTQSTTPVGLVAAYGLNEAQGTAVADASGRSNGGTVSGATWTTAGKFGAALSFDGSNDWVTVADAASLDVTRMTLEAWVRPTAMGGSWRTLVFKEQPGGMVYALYATQGSGVPAGQVNIGGERTATGPALPVNTWSHLAATFDGSALRLYVNGALSSTSAVAGSIPASTGVLRMGGNGVWAEWFAGQLDEVRVYDRALTQAEIQSDMQTPVGGTGPPPPPPPPPPDTQSPTAPPGITAAASPGAVDLAWQASSDNVGVTGYDVHRSTTSGFTPGSATRLTRVTTTTHRDSGLASGTYHYKVVAVDAAGNASAPSAQVSAVVPAAPSGLVAAYSFNEGSGTSVVDRSGTGNGGTVSGATWTTAGRYGGALTFDGVNDWVTIADSASLDVTRVTLEAWVRPTTLGGMWRTAVFKEQPGGMVYALYANQGSGQSLGQVNVGGERNAVGAAPALNTWTHLAVTYDGSAVRLFVNGAAAGTAAVTGNIPISTGVLRIGGNGVWAEWFVGQIDEVRVYNRALTQAQIQSDMQSPL
jgi:glucose/arabinose dehydrogenase